MHEAIYMQKMMSGDHMSEEMRHQLAASKGEKLMDFMDQLDNPAPPMSAQMAASQHMPDEIRLM